MNFLILLFNVIWFFFYYYYISLCIKNKLRWLERGILYLKKFEEKIIWNVNIKMFDYNLYFLELIKKELFDVIKIILLDWIKKIYLY